MPEGSDLRFVAVPVDPRPDRAQPTAGTSRRRWPAVVVVLCATAAIIAGLVTQLV